VLRRVLAAGLAAACVLVLGSVVRPPPDPVVRVVVASVDIAPGTVLSGSHLRLAEVPVEGRQPGALTGVDAAVGRRVGSGLALGETLTSRRLVPRGPVDGLDPGRVALHVVASDPASVDLLAPGASARVYPAGGGEVLARAAEVLATDPPATDEGVLSSGAPAARGVVLALDVGEAHALLTGHGSVEGPVVVTLVASPP
jgi:hypothetical protein